MQDKYETNQLDRVVYPLAKYGRALDVTAKHSLHGTELCGLRLGEPPRIEDAARDLEVALAAGTGEEGKVIGVPQFAHTLESHLGNVVVHLGVGHHGHVELHGQAGRSVSLIGDIAEIFGFTYYFGESAA